MKRPNLALYFYVAFSLGGGAASWGANPGADFPKEIEDFRRLLSEQGDCAALLGQMAGALHLEFFKGLSQPEVVAPDLSAVDLPRSTLHLAPLANLVRNGAHSQVVEYIDQSTLLKDFDVEFVRQDVVINPDWSFFLRSPGLSVERRWDLIVSNTSYLPPIHYVTRTSFPSSFKGNPSGKNLLMLPGYLYVDLYKEGTKTPLADFLQANSREAIGFTLQFGMDPKDTAYLDFLLRYATWEECFHHVDLVHWLSTGKSISPITNQFFNDIGMPYDFYLHGELAVVVAAKYEYHVLDVPAYAEMILTKRYPRFPTRHLRQLVNAPAMRRAVAEVNAP
jgi:hypothetical protein